MRLARLPAFRLAGLILHHAAFLAAALLCLECSAAAQVAHSCEKYVETRLALTSSLEDARFQLREAGPLQRLPRFDITPNRPILHRTYVLSSSEGKTLRLFTSTQAGVILIAAVSERSPALKIPVFFVGQNGSSEEELKADAQQLIFGDSQLLTGTEDFADVQFRIAKRASLFNEIRPYFRCGLPILLVCQSRCPTESGPLSAGLSQWIVSPQFLEADLQPASPQLPEEKPAQAEPDAKPGNPIIEQPKRAEAPKQPPAPPLQPEKPAIEQPKKAEAPKQLPAPPLQPEKPAIEQPKKAEAPKQPPAPPLKPEKPVIEQPKEAEAPKQPPEPPLQPERPVIEQPKKAEAPKQPSEPPVQPDKPIIERVPIPRETLPDERKEAEAPRQSPTQEGKSNGNLENKEEATPPPEKKRLALFFKTKGDAPISPATILESEGPLSVEGVPLQVEGRMLVADLPPDAFQRVIRGAKLIDVFKRNALISVTPSGESYAVKVDPTYVPLSAVTIHVLDANGLPVSGCLLNVRVPFLRQLGSGWAKLPSAGGEAIMTFRKRGGAYRLYLPDGVTEDDLLVTLTGPNLTLTNTSPGCGLEPKPAVANDELKARRITRRLRASGPVLLALLYPDPTLSDYISDLQGFWAKVIDLINAIAADGWEKKVLARVQPSPSSMTGILDQATGDKLLAADASARLADIGRLVEVSRRASGAVAGAQSPPLTSYNLSPPLTIVQKDAGLRSAQTQGEQRIVLISGRVQINGNDFCRRLMRADDNSNAQPAWLMASRKVYILEFWDENALEEAKRENLVEGVLDSNDTLYRCKIGGAAGDKVRLYAVAVSALEPDRRDAVFARLAEKLKEFITP